MQQDKMVDKVIEILVVHKKCTLTFKSLRSVRFVLFSAINSKDIYNFIKFLFQINAVLLNFLLNQIILKNNVLQSAQKY